MFFMVLYIIKTALEINNISKMVALKDHKIKAHMIKVACFMCQSYIHAISVKSLDIQARFLTRGK